MTSYKLIFGLSADPIHIGHVEMVTQSFEWLSRRGYPVEQAVLIPTYRRNPVGVHKGRLPETYGHRFRMCCLAADEIARRLRIARQRVRVSAIEAELAYKRAVPNYTAETLSLIRLRATPGEGLIFLMSSELASGPYPQFGRWYRPRAIVRLAKLALCPRPGFPLNAKFVCALRQQGADVIVLERVRTPNITSTGIRSWLRAGISPQALVHHRLLSPAVARYIIRHKLYTSSVEGSAPSYGGHAVARVAREEHRAHPFQRGGGDTRAPRPC